MKTYQIRAKQNEQGLFYLQRKNKFGFWRAEKRVQHDGTYKLEHFLTGALAEEKRRKFCVCVHPVSAVKNEAHFCVACRKFVY